MTRPRIAVIGAGHLGKFHTRLLANNPDVNFVGVADPVQAAREALAAECRTLGFSDFRNLLGRIDGAVVAAPTKLHHAIGTVLLSAGVHCLMEKPIAATTVEADELVALSERHHAILQVGHIERFNPAFAAIQPQLSSPKYLECARHTPYTFRSTDVGVVLDLMIHDLDIVLSLVRSPVRRVDAIGTAVIGPHEDVAQVRLTFENGAVANLSASRVSYLPQRLLQVWSRELFAAVDFADRQTTIVRRAEMLRAGEFRGEELSAEQKNHFKEHLFEELLPKTSTNVPPSNAMADEQADFLDCIRTGRRPRVTGEAGREALAIAEQVLRAIDEHAWDSRPTEPRPAILGGPHFPMSAAAEVPQREAG